MSVRFGHVLVTGIRDQGFLAAHQADETVEEVGDVLRGGRGFRVALEAEQPACRCGQALQRAVEQRDVRGAQVGGQRLLVHGKTVVLAGDGHAAGIQVFHGVVAAVVTELHLEGLGAGGQGQRSDGPGRCRRWAGRTRSTSGGGDGVVAGARGRQGRWTGRRHQDSAPAPPRRRLGRHHRRRQPREASMRKMLRFRRQSRRRPHGNGAPSARRSHPERPLGLGPLGRRCGVTTCARSRPAMGRSRGRRRWPLVRLVMASPTGRMPGCKRSAPLCSSRRVSLRVSMSAMATVFSSRRYSGRGAGLLEIRRQDGRLLMIRPAAWIFAALDVLGVHAIVADVRIRQVTICRLYDGSVRIS